VKEEKPNQVRVDETKPVEIEMRQQGLWVLARMIARKYIRDMEHKGQVNRESDDEKLKEPPVINLGIEIRQPQKLARWGNGEKS